MLVIMIQAMLGDIFLWFVVSGVFLAGFAVAFGAMALPGSNSNTVLGMPFWAMLGAFEPGEVERRAEKREKGLA